MSRSLHHISMRVHRLGRVSSAPATFAIVKHRASNLLCHDPGKDSLRVKRKRAARDG